MPLICDSHVHLYPGYSLHKFFHRAVENLNASLASRAENTEDCIRVLCLAERSDCNAFAELESRISETDSLSCRATREENSLCVKVNRNDVYIIAGRQIATAERLELLGLGLCEPIDDGQPFLEVLAEVRKRGGIAILPWSPGKWMFARQKIVEDILHNTQADQLIVGDSALRPQVFWMPRLITLARSRGFRVLAGTDPLPLKGEESRVGCYANYCSTQVCSEKPFESLVQFFGAQAQSELCGQRLGLWEVARRLIQLKVNA